MSTVNSAGQMVYSSLPRTSSTAQVNGSATTSNGLSPLTQSGTSTKITVASSQWNTGSNQFGNIVTILYNAGSVDPGSYGTYWVYILDPQRRGGNVTFLATTTPSLLTANDGVVFFGQITTTNAGGGTGAGGGSGPGGGGHCVIAGVMITMEDGSQKAVESLVKGDRVLGQAGRIETLTTDPEIDPGMPCYRLTFDNGTILKGCSSTHKLKTPHGVQMNVFDIFEGDQVIVRVEMAVEESPQMVTEVAVLTKKEFIGHQTVYMLHLDGSRTYYADGVLSHNANKTT